MHGRKGQISVNAVVTITLALSLPSATLGFPDPLRVGRENIPRLMAEATLVCKGEVIDAPPVTFSVNAPAVQLTATAIVRADRCFKGQPPSSIVPVLFDNVLPGGGTGGTPPVVLQRGDYRLYFLKPEGEEYVLVHGWFGQLPISRNLASDPANDANPMRAFEADFKAGLSDPNPELTVDSICMLGEMRQLRSKAELVGLLDSPDMLVRTAVWEAMLRLHDYSVLPAVTEWLLAQPPRPFSITLPKDALIAMEYHLVRQISMIEDPATLPRVVPLLGLPRPSDRLEILSAIRAMNSQESAPYLLNMLDDPDDDVAFSSMQGVVGLARAGPIDWVPSYEQFQTNRALYASLCRGWWRSIHREQ